MLILLVGPLVASKRNVDERSDIVIDGQSNRLDSCNRKKKIKYERYHTNNTHRHSNICMYVIAHGES